MRIRGQVLAAGWRRWLNAGRPGSRRSAVAVAVLAATVLAAVLAAGCRPREIVPTQPALLVQPARELLQYRRLVLPNGLKVFLVHNPQADASAAALAVGAGSLDDPSGRSGLAHFLEHMLFLGTEKFPEANAYTQYLSSHGGSSNAYTADDHTNYFFQVDNDAFEGALDRFAQFFVAPLFDQTYTDREMNAVDAEHAKNLENDFWRTRQVERVHFDPGHPISRFSTGNLDTLRGVTRAELLEFYRTHYSSNRMTLAVVGNLSLDALERLVRERFERVENRALAAPQYPQVYLQPKPALRLLRVEPVADTRSLSLHFPLPPVAQDYDARPLQLIGAVLGHEGAGSLLSLLKAEGLAQGLSAGMGESTKDYASLAVNIALTPQGLERYADVIRLTLGAIEGLRRTGIPRHVFDEARVMSALNYRYREVPDSGSLARQFSAMLQTYPLAALPDEPFLLRRYAPERYQDLLARLTPDNMLVTLVARGVATDDVERYYQARFSYVEQIGDPFRAAVRAEPDPRWHVSAPNRFVPRDVSLNDPDGPLRLVRVSELQLQDDGLPPALLERLRPLRAVGFTSAQAYIGALQERLSPAEQRRWLPALVRDAWPLPVRLLDTPQARVWYQPDWRFRQPKAEIRLKLFVAGAESSPRESMLAALYEAALDESLNEVGYPIREAGLGYGVEDVKGGLLLSLSGYSARMLDLLQFLVERLERVDVDAARFASLKEQFRRGLVNGRLDQPYRQSQYFVRMLLERPGFTRETSLAALEPLELADVKDYAARFLERTYVEGVVVGNLRRDEARAAIQRALGTLHAGVLPPAQRVEPDVRELPRGADWVFSERLDVNNSAVQFLYQVGRRNAELDAALSIVTRPLGEGFYHQMRTQQQLGYIVWAGAGDMRNVLNFYFLVQSAQYAPDELRRRMDGFIPGFLRGFGEMPPAAFEQYRVAAIRAKLERADGLAQVASGVYWAAFRNEERFTYSSDQVEALERISHAEVEQVLERALMGAEQRRLAIRLTGKGHAAGTPAGQPVQLPAATRAKAG